MGAGLGQFPALEVPPVSLDALPGIPGILNLMDYQWMTLPCCIFLSDPAQVMALVAPLHQTCALLCGPLPHSWGAGPRAVGL